MMTHDLNVWTALVAFATAAGLLTIIPGLDTMLVLRTAIAEGRHRSDGRRTWYLCRLPGLGPSRFSRFRRDPYSINGCLLDSSTDRPPATGMAQIENFHRRIGHFKAAQAKAAIDGIQN